MKTKLLGSYLTLLAVATLLGPLLAYGATTNIEVAFPSPTRNPCNGEQVNVSGNVHLTTSVYTDKSGGIHFSSHISNQGVSGIGALTGSRYQIPSTSNFSAYLGSATTMTLAADGRFVAQGSAPNFNVHQTFKITIDSNGVTTVSGSDFRTDCK
jgi:hypothetical protein